MKKLNLTECDWLKLSDYCKIIAHRIMQRLPSDWYITEMDIQGNVYDTIVHLLSIYHDGKQSPVSWCYTYAESYTYRDLMREYKRIKRNIQITTSSNDDDDEVRHSTGEGDVKELTVSDDSRIEARDMVHTLMSRIDDKGKRICEMVMQGYGQDEIARELGISQQAIAKRLSKMR